MNTNSTVVNIGSNANYVTPDLQKMAAAQSQMNASLVIADVLYSKTEYLPNLYDRFKREVKSTYAANRTLHQSAMKIAIELGFKIGTLRRNEAELAGLTDSEFEDREEILAENTETLQRAAITVKSEIDKVRAALRTISEPFNRALTEGFTISLGRDVQRMTASLEQQTAMLEALNAQRRVLTDAINALEVNITDIAKNVVLTTENLIAMGMLPPQVELVRLAVEQLKTTLADAAKGLNFVSLIHERDKLRDHINDLQKPIVTTQQERELMEQRIQLINMLTTIDDQRIIYRREADKTVHSLQAYLNLNGQHHANDQARFDAFIASSTALIEYLNTIAYSTAR